MDDRRGHIRGDRHHLDAVYYRADRAHVLLQRVEDRRGFSEDINSLQDGDREERGNRGGESEGGDINAMVIHDDTRSCAESAR